MNNLFYNPRSNSLQYNSTNTVKRLQDQDKVPDDDDRDDKKLFSQMALSS